jgi:hypothetical protein
MVGQGPPYKERRFAGMTLCDMQYDIGIEQFSVCKGLTRVQPYRKQISLKAELCGQEGKLDEYLCGQFVGRCDGR